MDIGVTRCRGELLRDEAKERSGFNVGFVFLLLLVAVVNDYSLCGAERERSSHLSGTSTNES